MKLDRYQRLETLGSGMSGEVYRAKDLLSGADVAVKTARFDQFEPANRERMRRMWLNELDVLSKLRHPYIVEVLDALVDEECGYLVMECLPGGTLKPYTKAAARLPFEQVLDIVYKLANALAFAHRHNIIHRDIKPANILLDSKKQPKLADFGAAFMLVSEDTQILDIGSLAYTAPECLSRHNPLFASDIFSLGVTAYQLLAGILPYRTDNAMTLTDDIKQGKFVPLQQVCPELPAEVCSVIESMLTPDLDQRPANGEAVQRLLEPLLHKNPSKKSRLMDAERFSLLRRLDEFVEFSDLELWQIASILRWARFEPGHMLIEEGKKGGSLYILLYGDADVLQQRVRLTQAKAGDFFGEMAFISASPRTRSASVVARSPVVLAKMSPLDFQQCSLEVQVKFQRILLKLLADRLRTADRRMHTLLQNT